MVKIVGAGAGAAQKSTGCATLMIDEQLSTVLETSLLF
jgi:hypothetical protein